MNVTETSRTPPKCTLTPRQIAPSWERRLAAGPGVSDLQSDESADCAESAAGSDTAGNLPASPEAGCKPALPGLGERSKTDHPHQERRSP